MDTTQLKTLCERLPGASRLLHPNPTNVLSYRLSDKTFAYFKTSEPEQWRFSIRVTPDRFVELTDVAGIKPARYMGRYHWVTIVDVRNVPAAYLVELVEWSYHKALGSLSKARRTKLLASNDAAT